MFSLRSLLKKSGCRTPRIELEEIGPAFDFVVRRTHMASEDLYKTAHRQPKVLKVGGRANAKLIQDRFFCFLLTMLPSTC